MSNIKKISVGIAVTLIVAVIAFGVFGSPSQENSSSITAKAVQTTGGVQEVKLTFKNYQYELSPSTLVKGVPVKMTVDLDSVYGCMRDIVISSFGVKKYVREGDNIITFTPDKTGTFNIACSMNMGRGSFSVVESDGSSSDFVEKSLAPAATGGSCGSGSGGCGCGA